jgi:hypothetical protein
MASVRRELAHAGPSFGSRSFGFVLDKGSKLVVFDTSYFGHPDRIAATNSPGLGLWFDLDILNRPSIALRIGYAPHRPGLLKFKRGETSLHPNGGSLVCIRLQIQEGA